MRSYLDNKSKFDIKYFLQGPYKGAKIKGILRLTGKYYWARRFYARLIERITPKNGNILEIGCGFGDLLIFLEQKYKTTGIDISKDAIYEAKKKLNRTTLQILTAEEINTFGKHSFDTVIACHVLEHLKNPQIVLDMINRLLKPGGILFIVMPNPSSIGRSLKGKDWVGYQDKTHISLYEPQKWFKLLKSARFMIQKTFGDGLWDSPYIPIIPKIIQQIVFGLPAIMQTLVAIPFIPSNLGESVAIIAKKYRENSKNS